MGAVKDRLALFAVIIAASLLAAGCTNLSSNNGQNATGQAFDQNPDGASQPTGLPLSPFQWFARPGASQPGTLEPDLSKPVPKPPIGGRNVTIALGNMAISYYSVAASYDALSLGADIYFSVKNNGNRSETFATKLASQTPPWCWQFFAFQNETMALNGGEERTLHFYASNDEPGLAGFLFDFWQKQDKSDKVTANVTVYRGEEGLVGTSIIYGQVRDNATGSPVAGAAVEVNLYTARWSFRAVTDSGGNYAARAVGIDDLESFFGQQPRPYKSLDYFITVRKDGYNYYYRDGLAPMRGEKLKADIGLDALTGSEKYALVWEAKVSEPYGFFKVAADRAWNYAIAVQSKHAPEMNKPTSFFVFNASTGKQLLAQPTENECWGLSVAVNALTAAVSCHNGTAYAIGLSGNASIIWSQKDRMGNMRREAEVSDDGKYVLTGPDGSAGKRYSVVLLDAKDGAVVTGIEEDYGWVRNAKFSADGSRFVIGASDGVVAMFETATGRKLWENRIGEFPFVLEMDSEGNVYAGGKGRTLFSFFANGSERWSFRVPDHTPLSGTITADGKRLVFGTGQGWVYCVDARDGGIIWRSRITAETLGHNGVSMSADGARIAAGGAPRNTLDVMDSSGNILFTHTAKANDDPCLADKFATIGHAVSESTQKGALGTAMSADGRKILVAYGDDYVREFEMK